MFYFYCIKLNLQNKKGISIVNSTNNNYSDSNNNIIAIPIVEDVVPITFVTTIFHFTNIIVCHSSNGTITIATTTATIKITIIISNTSEHGTKRI